MDPRVPELHHLVNQLLGLKADAVIQAADLLMVDTELLTPEVIHRAFGHLTADLPSPLRATLHDLGRLLEGNLPTDDIVPLKLYSPTG
jgi:hypothetical protein